MKPSSPLNCDDLDALLPAYADHTLSAAAAAPVAAHVAGCAACRQRVAQFRDLAAALDATSPAVPGPALRVKAMALLAQEKALLAATTPAAPAPERPAARAVSWWPMAATTPWLRAAAAVLLVAGGGLLGRHWPAPIPMGNAMSTAASANEGPASAQRLAQALARTDQLPVSASGRIQLVKTSGTASVPGDATVQVLINTLNFDPSPNVRLAAGEALYRLRADPRVGDALVQSLPIQTDPNVQITLIELLVALRDPRAVPPLKHLARQPDALPMVRQQAEAGLGQLL